jgi:HlyD family secretion protein
MTTRTKWLAVTMTIAIVAVVAVLATRGSGVAVETARVTRDTLRTAVQEEGRTRVRERYTVAAPATGKLARISLSEGDRVAAGATVARIYPAPTGVRDATILHAQADAADAHRREAAAHVSDAQRQADQMQREAERTRALVKAGALSPQAGERADLASTSAGQELEAARAALHAADADAAAAHAALIGSSASTAGGSVTVSAPSGGRVLRVLEQSERVVQAGTPLVEIGDAHGLEVVVDVLSDDAVQIQPGDVVQIDQWGGPPITGRVRLVEPNAFTKVSALGVDEQRVRVIVALTEVPSGLGAGYRVEARIITWTGANVLAVRTSALFQQSGAWHVFAVVDGKAQSRTVTLGHRSAEAAEVIAGLRDGDVVVLFPSDQVAAGVRVTPHQPSS